MNQSNATHRVELGGEVEFVNAENFTAVIDQLVAKYPGQKPVVTPVRPNVAERSDFSEEGKARSDRDRLEAKLNGFSPKPPVYAAGSRVNEIGVRNAESSRKEYDALPTVKNACASLVHVVGQEQRRDVVVERVSNIRMTGEGRIVNQSTTGIALDERAFGGFLSRTGIGGRDYLTRCPTHLRAVNVNHWLEELKLTERAQEAEAFRKKQSFEPLGAKFRTRLNRAEREIFAVVSPSYGSYDCDMIASALGQAAPADARGSVVYDGTRTKFEVLFHSNILPSEYVAGEFFKAGVLISTDDTGGGSIRVSAVVWQNLCLNLIILDECVRPIAALRHIGSVTKLAERFRWAFGEAMKSIEGFQAKWGYALNDDVGEGQDMIPDLSIEAIIPGLFNGIIERELVPVRGARKEVVPQLVKMLEKDQSAATAGKDYVSRAAIVNAFTRYAHEVNTDPYAQDEIERAAGGLLNITRHNKVLPFEPIDF